MNVTDYRQDASLTTDKRPRLLLAEDEAVQRLLLQRILEEHGYEVETASSGNEALERVLRGGVRILITDWDMPGMDGDEVCRRIRSAQLDEHVYIFMITSHQSVDDGVFALTAGANDYMRKPVNKEELLARLASACEIVRVQAALRATLASLKAAYAEIARRACVDPQLPCYNKRYLNDQLPRAVEHARRHGTCLALIMADMDHFKAINDAHGHMVGDQVLAIFVERVNASLRSSDWIVRFGGEEFSIVLLDTALEPARGVAEKLRRACADEPFETSAGSLTVTISLGVASLEPSSPGDDENTLITRADAALYRSKQRGRNCVSV